MTTLSSPRAPHNSRTSSDLMVLVPRQGHQTPWLLKPGRWTVGSAATCSYRLSGEGVQLRHAVLACGPGSVVLKAWDARTWMNGEPVCGEVRLRTGDSIKLGAITLDVVAAGTEDVLSQLSEFVTVEPVRNDTVVSTPPALINSEPVQPVVSSDVEMSLIEEFRRQIHELRNDLTHAWQRQPPDTPVVAAPVIPTEWLTELNDLRKRVVELEQSSATDRQLANQIQHDWNVAQAAWTQRESEWTATQAHWTSEREQLMAQVSAEWLAEREQLRSELAEHQESAKRLAAKITEAESAHDAALTQAHAEREQLQPELESLRSNVSQLSLSLSEAETARKNEAAQWHLEQTQLRQELTAIEKNATRFASELEAARTSHRADADHWLAELNRLQTELAAERHAAEQFEAEVRAAERQSAEQSWSRDRKHFETQIEQFATEQQTLKRQLDDSVAERTQLEMELRQTVASFTEAVAAKQEIDRQQHELSKSQEELQAARAELQEEQNRWLSEQADRAVEQARLAVQREQWQQEQAEHEAALEKTRRELEAVRSEWSTRLSQEQSLLAAAREQLECQRQTLQSECHREPIAAPSTKPVAAAESPAFSAPGEMKADDLWGPSLETTIETESSPADTDWATAQSVHEPVSQRSISRNQERPTWANDLLAETDLGDDWSKPLSRPEPIATEAGSRDDLSDTNSQTSLDSMTKAEAPVQDLRAKLAAMFDLPSLPSSSAVEESSDRDEPDATTPIEPVSSEAEGEERISAEEITDDLTIPQLDEPTEINTASPATTPLSFAANEDRPEAEENVDDSVSRYMQRLLARSRGESEHSEDSSGSMSASETEPSVSAADLEQTVAPINDQTEDVDAVISLEPVHQQDHNALRTATAQLRQVANLQALHNVKQHSRKRIYSAFKTKIALATFAFLLGLGFLTLGYHGKPAIIVLGGCSICIGILTWFDMFISIRESRQRSARLSKRTVAK